VEGQDVEEGEDLDPNNIYFDDEIVGGAVPKEYIKPVEDGIREIAKKGPSTASRWSTWKRPARREDPPGRLAADAFKLAGRESFREVQLVAGIKLLEPIMNVVVVAPDEYSGAICGDISRRRGMIEETSSDKGRVTSRAKVPLANLFRLHQRPSRGDFR